MTKQSGTSSCPMTCWVIAALAGIVTFLISFVIAKMGFLIALFFGAVVFVVLGLLLGWLFCKPAETAQVSAPAPKPATPAVAPAPAASPAPAATPEPAKSVSPAPAAAEFVMKPSKPLAGEADLDSRKGSWKYTADTTNDSAPQSADVDYGGDGTVEGTRPAALSAARDGKADDLKRIKGIGPKLEILCNELGFYHFDQIAGWSADEVAWVNANLAGFKGRVTRDNWVEQAKLLAAGGETEFSKRVDKGGVY